MTGALATPSGVAPTGGRASSAHDPSVGRSLGPWRTAWRRLRRDRAAMVSLGGLCLIAIACLLAPLYASAVSGTNPFATNLNGAITVEGKTVPVMAASTTGLGLGTTPIGPTYALGPYALGADNQGRDVAARLFYGGRNSLMIAGAATALTLVFAVLIGLACGFFGGIVDAVLARILDVLWAFPIYLLAISLSIVLISHGFSIGPIEVRSGSLWLPVFIIGVVYVPYVARPIRGQTLSLMQSEFILAAVSLGAPPWRIFFKDLLPNVMPRVIVFVPILLALDMVTESSLSFLSIGVQPPDASWGTIIQDGQGLLYSRPAVALAPGIAIAVTVLALNILGDGVRDAFDPRAKVRIV